MSVSINCNASLFLGLSALSDLLYLYFVWLIYVYVDEYNLSERLFVSSVVDVNSSSGYLFSICHLYS